MKKTLVFLSSLVLSIVLFGQNSYYEYYPENESRIISSDKTVNFGKKSDSKDYGDILWSEDFGGGSIPAGWVTVDNNSNNWVWYWSDDARPGTLGTYSSNNDTFFATTASNGYIMISGDIYNGAGGFTDMDSYFVTAPINCDTATSVLLVFEQVFRYCCSSTNISQIVSVSNDNINWVDFDVVNNVLANATSNNPDVVSINISQIAAGQSSVYLKFHKSGASHYFWAIDDIFLTNVPDNDIRLEQVYISSVGLLSGNYEYLGFYSSIPVNQITPISFMADIHNAGNYTQHDVDFNAVITDANTVQVYNQSHIENFILPDSMPFFEIPSYFNGFYEGEYTLSLSAQQAEIDEIPEDNIHENIAFSFNSNKVYARDYIIDSRIGVTSYSGGADGDFIGVNYYIIAPDTIESLTVFIDDNTEINTVVIAQLYKRENGDRVLVLESQEYYIQLADIGEWITIPYLPISPGDNVLEPHTEYTAGLECYGMSSDLYFGSDKSGPHLFSFAAVIRLGASWYWTAQLAAIRINLSGANVLPFITSIPENEVDFVDPFEYFVTTYDQQGLPVTLSATTLHPDINMQATDNGDGTMNILIPPISTSSFAGEEFMISIVVDNGIATNMQEFWVSVANIVVVEEIIDNEILIYPNPVKDILHLNNQENSVVQIYSVYGGLIYSNHNSQTNLTVDMSGFKSGTYFIRIIHDNKVMNSKFTHVK